MAYTVVIVMVVVVVLVVLEGVASKFAHAAFKEPKESSNDVKDETNSGRDDEYALCRRSVVAHGCGCQIACLGMRESAVG